MKKTILTFGTFDGVHRGHKHMLLEAAKLGTVIVALAPDNIVKRLKGRLPVKTYKQRKRDVENLETVSRVVEGDRALGAYGIIKEVEPDAIVLGFDQKALKKDLEEWLESQEKTTPVTALKPFKPKTYKSSILNHTI